LIFFIVNVIPNGADGIKQTTSGALSKLLKVAISCNPLVSVAG